VPPESFIVPEPADAVDHTPLTLSDSAVPIGSGTISDAGKAVPVTITPVQLTTLPTRIQLSCNVLAVVVVVDTNLPDAMIFIFAGAVTIRDV